MDFETARRNMIESQIRPNKVTDSRVLAAMAEIPREKFLPLSEVARAYVDEDVPVGHGRYLMEPMVIARLLQALNVRNTDAGLLVGAGTGYSAALLGRLAGAVVAIEPDRAMGDMAEAVLADLGIANVSILDRPFDQGCAEQGPYDVVLFDGAVARIPDAIIAQLSDGGRLAAVERPGGWMGKAILVTRHGNGVTRRPVFDAAIPHLPEMEEEAGFVF